MMIRDFKRVVSLVRVLGFAELRDSERRALQLTSNTGMAVFYDFGKPK